jgi:hypothetical protein
MNVTGGVQKKRKTDWLERAKEGGKEGNSQSVVRAARVEKQAFKNSLHRRQPRTAGKVGLERGRAHTQLESLTFEHLGNRASYKEVNSSA